MPAAKKTTTRRTAAGRKRPSAKRGSAKEPAALRRLNKSLESASDALNALRKDVGKDVGGGAQDLYKGLQKFVKDARRDSGKLSKTLQREFAQLEKRIADASKSGSRSGGKRKTASRSTAKKAGSRARSAASRTRRAGSRTASRSRSRRK
jgi:hypothetical protein